MIGYWILRGMGILLITTSVAGVINSTGQMIAEAITNKKYSYNTLYHVILFMESGGISNKSSLYL